MRKVMVISPHLDDETLGVGGTLLRHRAEGDEVYWCLVTHAFADSIGDYQRQRLAIIEKVSLAYGCRDYSLLDFPAGGLDTVPMKRLIDTISGVIQSVRPNIVYSVSASDVNTDHDAVYRALMVATKPAYATSITEILLYEVPSSTNWAFPEKSGTFSPDTFIDISPYLETKLEILSLYGPEAKPFPHARSMEAIKSLALYRGSTVNITYAEAFTQARRIIR